MEIEDLQAAAVCHSERYTRRELEFLLNEVLRYPNIVESPNSHSETKHRKALFWQHVALKLSQAVPSESAKTAIQLRNWWKRTKSRAKQRLAQNSPLSKRLNQFPSRSSRHSGNNRGYLERIFIEICQFRQNMAASYTPEKEDAEYLQFLEEKRSSQLNLMELSTLDAVNRSQPGEGGIENEQSASDCSDRLTALSEVSEDRSWTNNESNTQMDSNHISGSETVNNCVEDKLTPQPQLLIPSPILSYPSIFQTLATLGQHINGDVNTSSDAVLSLLSNYSQTLSTELSTLGIPIPSIPTFGVPSAEVDQSEGVSPHGALEWWNMSAKPGLLSSELGNLWTTNKKVMQEKQKTGDNDKIVQDKQDKTVSGGLETEAELKKELFDIEQKLLKLKHRKLQIELLLFQQSAVIHGNQVNSCKCPSNVQSSEHWFNNVPI